MNPRADHFQPTGTVAVASTEHQTHLENTNAAVGKLSNVIQTIVKEVCSLRDDVETLKKGGWTVTVGPFTQLLESTQANTLSTQESCRAIEDVNCNGAQNLDLATFCQVPATSQVSNEQGRATTIFSEGDMSGSTTANRVDNDHTTTGAYSAVNPDSADKKRLSTKGRKATKAVASSNQVPSQPTNGCSRASQKEDQVDGGVMNSTEDTYIDRSRNVPGWKPAAIRDLAPIAIEDSQQIPSFSEMKTFSFDFLHTTFGGRQHSPGLYHVSKAEGPCILLGRTYYALDATNEPYLPAQPGLHGAKLTAFFNTQPEEEEEAAYKRVPLFITASPWMPKEDSKYVYFGSYTQKRWSDKLDYDTIVDRVPQHVKMYWAEQLSEVGRPEWVSDALMKHFFAKPEYEGAMPASMVDGTEADNEFNDQDVTKDIIEYAKELRDWEKDARVKVGLLSKENILAAFDKADADDPPGLRLWWEYLHCDGWDAEFYRMLVSLHAKAMRV